MLDHNPDGDARTTRPGGGEADGQRGESRPAGGLLARWRAGLRPTGEPVGRHKPLWRRIVVGLTLWLSIGAAGLAALSLLAVFTIGWIGPPPTFNMAGVAMSGKDVRSRWVDLKDMSPHIVRAVIATEDQNFCSHKGFDFREIDKAMAEAEAGGRVRGASTISQQTAKNVFLWNGGGWLRKGAEAWFTVLEEWMWTKPRIMEIYLNVAEWGDGVFGVEQASQERFGVSAKDLTPAQAAALAAVLPNPNRIRINGSYATGRRNTQIQSLMAMVRRDGLDSCVIGP